MFENTLKTATLQFQNTEFNDSKITTKTGTQINTEVTNPYVTTRASVDTSNNTTHAINNFKVETPLSQQQWNNNFNERVTYLVNQNVKAATIQIKPPELGHIEIKIKLDDEQARLIFNTQHASVKDAVESAIPKLKEMLNENGINLVDVDVSDKQFAEQNAEANTADNETDSQFFDNDSNEKSKETSIKSDNLIDYYV